MGFGGISPGSLLIILMILILLFGTNRIKSIAEELGASVKSFRKGLIEEDQSTDQDKDDSPSQ